MSTASETFVALGAIDPELATPFLARGQRLVLDPTAADLATADAAIVRAAFIVDKAMLDRMPALKVLARTGVGTDLVDVAEAARRGIPVVITPGSNTSAVAEGVFAHLSPRGEHRRGIRHAGPRVRSLCRYLCRISLRQCGRSLGCKRFRHPACAA